MKAPKILIVEDEKATLFAYSKFLSKKNYDVKTATSLHDAKQLIASEIFNVILLDLRLPDGNALNLIKETQTVDEFTSIIVISGLSEISTAVEAMKHGADNFLTKPIDMENLEISLRHSLEASELRKRNSRHKRLSEDTPSAYFGVSEQIEKVKEYSRVASINDSVVLLLGETGTGKGVFARWIHDHSSRKDGTFVELNCSSLRGELLRSELYGHTRGAFTSAIKDRQGLIEVADGGTLFLDEIGDMDLEVQAELLKTIEEKKFRRIGENKLRQSDFRLICATNRDLVEASKEGKFRTDLYYRICVFPIHLPSLRERKNDIAGLLNYLLRNHGYKHFPLNRDLVKALSRYPWPGNIREACNMVERALLLAQGEPLSTAHFPGLDEVTIPLHKSEDMWDLDEIEKYHIIRAMEHFNNDKIMVSKALGISLSSLYRKLDSINNAIPA